MISVSTLKLQTKSCSLIGGYQLSRKIKSHCLIYLILHNFFCINMSVCIWTLPLVIYHPINHLQTFLWCSLHVILCICFHILYNICNIFLIIAKFAFIHQSQVSPFRPFVCSFQYPSFISVLLPRHTQYICWTFSKPGEIYYFNKWN